MDSVFNTVITILKALATLVPDLFALIKLAASGGDSDHPLYPQIQALFKEPDSLDKFLDEHLKPGPVTSVVREVKE